MQHAVKEFVDDFVEETAPELLQGIGLKGVKVGTKQHFTNFMYSGLFRLNHEDMLREDIEDLIKMTVERMDIYHIVGALFLKFCIDFYAENKMYESCRENNVPRWMLAIFMISNFVSIGYLVMAVWNAMHAAVSASAVGTRLRTAVQRLTVPNSEDIQRVTVKRLLSQVIDQWRRSRPKAVDKSDPLARYRADFKYFDHFRNFQKCSKHWLAFDEHSRFCMAMGLNQMLQALSYFLVGPLTAFRTTAALVVLAGVQFLALLVMQLDFVPTPGTKRKHLVRALSFFVLPTCLATSLNLLPLKMQETIIVDVLVLVCFVLHACWLFHVAEQLPLISKQLRTAMYLTVLSGPQVDGEGERGQGRDASSKSLWPLQVTHRRLLEDIAFEMKDRYGDDLNVRTPKMDDWFPLVAATDAQAGDVSETIRELRGNFQVCLRGLVRPAAPVGTQKEQFAASIEEAQPWYERCRQTLALIEEAKRHHGEENELVQQSIQTVHRAEVLTCLADLEQQVRDAENQEYVAGSLQPSFRMGYEQVTRAHAGLQASIARAPNDSAEVLLARKSCSWLQLWRRAPRIFAEFKALLWACEDGWSLHASPDYKQRLDTAYQMFLAFCHDLQLGIRCEQGSGPGGLPLRALSAVVEVPYVRTQPRDQDSSPRRSLISRTKSSNALSGFVWIRCSGRPGVAPDINRDATGLDAISCEGLLMGTLPNFTLCAEVPLPPQKNIAKLNFAANAGLAAAKLELPQADGSDPDLPQRIVRFYTIGCGLVFAMGALMRVPLTADVMLNSYAATGPRRLSALSTDGSGVLFLDALNLTWPEPEGLFEIEELFCTRSHVLVSNGYALFAAPRVDGLKISTSALLPKLSLGRLRKVGNRATAAVLCGGQSCDALLRHGQASTNARARSGTMWQLSQLPQSLGTDRGAMAIGVSSVLTNESARSLLPLPSSWRLVSAVVAECMPAPCEAAWLAGWDGGEITVATAGRKAAHGGIAWDPWVVEPRFAVRPSAACAEGVETQGLCQTMESPSSGADGYNEILSMQLGASGRTLAVLLGAGARGAIDGWDLADGSFLGRWELLGGGLGGNATSMCHDGNRLMLASHGKDGAVLEEGTLPSVLAALEGEEAQKTDRVIAVEDGSQSWISSALD